jgi:membrane-associated phospholipid phosphatase
LAIKFSVRRRRPEGSWGGIYRSTDPHSFPSGHATRASMLAVLSIALVPPWLALLVVIWAPLVSFARVAMGVHYLSDVLAGIALGVLLGVGFTWLY